MSATTNDSPMKDGADPKNEFIKKKGQKKEKLNWVHVCNYVRFDYPYLFFSFL